MRVVRPASRPIPNFIKFLKKFEDLCSSLIIWPFDGKFPEFFPFHIKSRASPPEEKGTSKATKQTNNFINACTQFLPSNS